MNGVTVEAFVIADRLPDSMCPESRADWVLDGCHLWVPIDVIWGGKPQIDTFECGFCKGRVQLVPQVSWHRAVAIVDSHDGSIRRFTEWAGSQ